MNKTNFTVLLVEDHEITLRVVKMMLTDMGGTIDAISTGKEALELFHENNYELVLLDVGLPDINGFTVAEQMRKLKSPKGATPIVMVSAYSEEAYTEKALSMGLNDYVVKPFTVEQCQNIVNKYVVLKGES